MFSDGWIALALMSPYRVDWRRPDGAWVRGQPLPAASVRIDQNEKCAALVVWAPRANLQCTSEATDRYSWPQFLPPFLGKFANTRLGTAPRTANILGTPEGNLLIRRTPSVATGGLRYDVIDRQGQLSGYLMLPASEAIVGFGTASVFTIRTDQDDVQWLRRHRWLR
jgi:hypothetical protein